MMTLQFTPKINRIEGDGWWVEKWDVESKTQQGTFYRVARNKKGDFGCNCPGWKFRREECNHIKRVKAQSGELVNQPILRVQEVTPKEKVEPVQLKEIVPGLEVWGVVKHNGQVMRLKLIVEKIAGCEVRARSKQTGRGFDVPLHLIFIGRPIQSILDTAY